MQKININKMNYEDLEKIQSKLLQDFDDFWTPSILKSEFENPNCQVFVALYEDEIVGFASILQILDEIHLNNIVVKKDFRNLGIGKSLLEHLITESKKISGITLITLEVNEENKIAIKLYKSYGFEELGKRKNYYGQNKNAIIMTKYFK